MTASPARGRCVPGGELDLALDRETAARLVARLRAGTGRLPLEAGADPAPYQRFFREVTVAVAPGRKVALRMVDAGDTLAITGDPVYLGVLAENVEGLADSGDVDTHVHVDYFPDHFYLEEGSAPATLHLVPESTESTESTA